MTRESTRLRTARERRADARERSSAGSDTLAKVEAYARIASAIIIPFAIAFTGWWVQSSVAEATIKKDYVAMAMNVLKEGKAEPEIITWAAQVVKDNSPTPLSNELNQKIIRAALASSQARLSTTYPPPPAYLMEPAKQVRSFPLKQLQDGSFTEREIVKRWIDDREVAQLNAINLKFLQEYVSASRKADEDLKETLLKLDSEHLIKEEAAKRR